MARKKTIAQKKIEGTDRSDRSVSIPTSDRIPAASKSLPKEALPYYHEFAQHLLDNNALQDADRIVLERAAKCALQLDKAEQRMDKVGDIQTYKTGNRNVSPEFTIFTKTESRFLDYCSLLGISPKARHLMSGTFSKPAETEKDAFSILFGEGKRDNN